MKWPAKLFTEIYWVFVLWPRQCAKCYSHCWLEKMRRYEQDKPAPHVNIFFCAECDFKRRHGTANVAPIFP